MGSAVNIEPAICNGHLPYHGDGAGGRGGWGVQRRGGEGPDISYSQVE